MKLLDTVHWTEAEREAFEQKCFEAWMAQVDAVLVARCGLDHRDLPDIAYRDLHDRGACPREAARKAIKAAKEE